MEETISLQEIYEVIKKRIGLIISLTIAGALIAAVVSFFILTPIYQANTQFIVNQEKKDAPAGMQVDTNTIRTNVELINTYKVVITSNAIMDEVVKELKLDKSPESIASKVSVSSEQNSQVVTVSVKDADPALAADIANTTVAVFKEQIPELMNVDNVKVLAEAQLKENPRPVEPRPQLNIAIATVLGLMVGVGLAFLLEYLDKTVRTEADLEKMELTVIGQVYTMSSEDIRRSHPVRTEEAKGGFSRVQG